MVQITTYTVYVLYSKTHDKIYIGCTSNLIARFHSHNSLSKKGWTIKFRPWEVVYCEYFEQKKEAQKRETYFKGSSGRRRIRSEFIK